VWLKLICNPAAGRGRAGRRLREVEERLAGLGARVDVHRSSSPADLIRASAESSRGGFDRIVVCGGDGTLNLALREFDRARATVALVPLGSGDDFARVNGVPREVGAACDLAVHGSVREVDIALANGLPYTGVAGVGFDSEVARYANEHAGWLRGSAIYLYSILRVLPRFRPRRVRIDGAEEEIMFAVFGNSPQYGGGIRIVPGASLSDGLLDACIVHRTSRWQLLATLPRAYSGTHIRKQFVETRRAGAFTVDSEIPMEVFADGEPLTFTPVRFEIAPGKLKLVSRPA
jgi:diacylglycerol kinase (ATP)